MISDGQNFKIPYNYIAPYLDGVYMAVNAIPDSYLVYSAHDCGYYKAEKIAANHDFFSDLLGWDSMNRIVRTGLESQQYIMGGADKLSKKLQQVAQRYKPSAIFVARSNIVIVSGDDIMPVVRDIQKKVDTPLIVIPDSRVEADYITGYLDAIGELLLNQPKGDSQPKDGHVSLIGYVFDRHEGDNIGNVSELERMAKGAGASGCTTWLDGRPLKEITKDPDSSLIVNIVEDWQYAERIASKHHLPMLDLGLPLGIQKSVKWVERLSEKLSKNSDGEEFISENLERLIPQMEWIIPRFFAGKRVAVFSDRLLMPHMCSFLEELGCQIAAVGQTSADFSKRTEKHISSSHTQLPSDVNKLRAIISDMADRKDLDLVIGNSLILQILRRIPVAAMEFGYPSNNRHALFPAPYLGFNGVRVLVERMVNAIMAAARHKSS